MLEVIQTIFWGLLLLVIIVFIHEAGHFTAARLFKLRVKEFMIGLPGPRIAFKRKETSYGITAVPLGGYCLIAGMERGKEGEELEKALTFISYFGQVCEEEADRAGEKFGFDLVEALDALNDWGTVRRFKQYGLIHYAISAATINGIAYEEGASRLIPDPQAYLTSERKLTYTALPWWKRVIILLAGSLANLIVAMALLITLIMVQGAQVATTTIDSVSENSPAEEIGLVAGDTLLSLEGEDIGSWEGFITALREHEPGAEVELGYAHEGSEYTATVTLADNEGVPILGVTSRPERQDIGFLEAAEFSVMLIGQVLTTIVQLVNPTTFADTIGQTSSVVGISIEARAAAASGPFNFILLIAALSVSIGIMNLLPIPPLDGGKIIVETIERIFRRRIPVSVINGITLVGFAAMILLIVVATNADIQRYFLGG